MMKTPLKTLLILLFITLTQSLFAADKYIKRELRGVWIATVYNIDWPSSTGISVAMRNTQKKEMQKYLDTLKTANINAVYFQVRPMADALYKSSYEPWSSFLTGNRGSNPGWDPLAWMMEECHRRGMECHAWINPYRFAKSQEEYTIWATKQDRDVKNKGLLIQHGGNYIFNPALEETRQRIVDVCREIIEKYEVDGIIFDDYFYPSGMPASSAADDYKDYTKYQQEGGKLGMGDWRRKNINMMVADVYNMIQQVDPSVAFGISPAGAACSDPAVAASHGVSPIPKGSDWQYNGIFSDPVAWLQEGTIDYISPQIYWKTDHSTNPFGPMTEWWSTVAKKFGRHHYASHSLTFLQTSNTTTDWVEVGKQLQFSRTYTKNKAPGAIYYSACDIDGKKVSGLGNWLLKNKYKSLALPPAIDWKDHFPYDKVTHLRLEDNTLSWDAIEKVRYCVYAIPQNITKRASTSTAGSVQTAFIRTVTYDNHFTLPPEFTQGYYYAVSILDRFNNEYEPRYTDEEEILSPIPALVWPQDNAIIRPGVNFICQNPGADRLTLEVSRNKLFTDLLISTEDWIEEEMLRMITEDDIWKEGTYYWRITSSTTGCEDTHSPIRQFTIDFDAQTDGTRVIDIAQQENAVNFHIEGRQLLLTRPVQDIRIHTLSGILVAQERQTDAMDLSRCQSGIYIITIHDKHCNTVQKVYIH